MKRKLFFPAVLALVLAFLKHAPAQNSTDIYEFSCPNVYSGHNIVRHLSSGNEFVAYHLHGTKPYFAYTNVAANTAYEFLLPSGLRVHDFSILGNTVYFCGNDSINAIIGKFDCSVFFSTSGHIEYAKFPTIENFFRIETYTDPGSGLPSVAALGYDMTTSGLTPTRAVYLLRDNGLALTGYYRSISIGNNTDIFTDIAVTKNYIVAVGVYSYSPPQAFMGWVDKANTAMANYDFPNDPDLNTGYLVCALKDDDIAVANTVYDNTSHVFYNRIHTYDISIQTELNSQDIALPDKSAPDDLLYLDGDNSLLMMQFTAGVPLVLYIDPYSSNYVVDHFHYSGFSYEYNLDRISPTRFLVSGPTSSHTHAFVTRSKTAGNTSNCLVYDNLKAVQSVPMQLNPVQNQLSISNVGFTPVSIFPQTISINNSCTEP